MTCSPSSLCGFHGLYLKCPSKSHILNIGPPGADTWSVGAVEEDLYCLMRILGE